jgi:hypothetical protein
MTRQDAHSMTESMKAVMYGWDSAKEDGIQDKTDGEDHDNSLFRERDVMNVLKLLYSGHSLPLGSVQR